MSPKTVVPDPGERCRTADLGAHAAAARLRDEDG